ncbi:hypothetical protein [Mycolicibacterium sp. CBMA 226]|uniref:hypothetical protein n=1 Tax=Mycolicibacterium sp. CBMA 226 TaxID=2606611 RepID=UPI0012DD04C1|nr:hypothetical protein [Mycolicibacterium sp. CBMA 226]MUL76389.1 hypothetical protein [Mycolicibacterium sp. CBMA 226]
MRHHLGLNRGALAVFAVIVTLVCICAGAIVVASKAWHAASEPLVSPGIELVDDSQDQTQQQLIDQQMMIAAQQQAEQQNELAQQEAQQAEQQGLLVEQQVQAGQ